MTTKIFNKEIKFSKGSLVTLVGGHPEGGFLIVDGVVFDTENDAEPRYYCHIIMGNQRAVYPYTASKERIFSQSELAEATDRDLGLNPKTREFIDFFSKHFK